MPTSKDILNEATKAFKDNKISEMACGDVVKQGIADVAAFAKARAELGTSINSMKSMITANAGRVKELNSALTDLQKAAPVMKAPADAKVYNQLVADLKGEVKSGMEWDKKMKDQLTKAESFK